MATAADDGFTMVTRGGRKSGRARRKKSKALGRGIGFKYNACHQKEANNCSVEEEQSKAIRSFERAKEAITCTGFVKDLCSQLKIAAQRFSARKKPMQEMVCYGLGNVSVHSNARLQLACAAVIKDALKLTQVYFFEPLLTPMDAVLVEHAGFTLITENERGVRLVTCPTIFFMPHCNLGLYSNVLWANWGREALEDVVIVGNSFRTYASNTTWTATANQNREGNCVFRLLPLVREHSVPTSPGRGSDARQARVRVESAFNNTSVLVFPPEALATEQAAGILRTRPSDIDSLEAVRLDAVKAKDVQLDAVKEKEQQDVRLDAVKEKEQQDVRLDAVKGKATQTRASAVAVA